MDSLVEVTEDHNNTLIICEDTDPSNTNMSQCVVYITGNDLFFTDVQICFFLYVHESFNTLYRYFNIRNVNIYGNYRYIHIFNVCRICMHNYTCRNY